MPESSQQQNKVSTQDHPYINTKNNIIFIYFQCHYQDSAYFFSFIFVGYDEVKYETVGATDKQDVVPDAVCYYLRGERVCTPPASTTATP